MFNKNVYFSFLIASIICLPPAAYSLPKYDLSKQKDYSCVVQEVLKIREKKIGSVSEIYFIVRSSGRDYSVYAGPRWFLGAMGRLKKGDRVGVCGSLAGKFRGRELILAIVLVKDGVSVWLRNYDGQPFWEMKDGGPSISPGGKSSKGGKGQSGGKGPGGGRQ